MSHITKVNDLYRQTVNKITKSGDAWKDFLECQGRVYQMNFFNACMVYAQRKEAVILSSFDGWKRMDRPVQRGSRGIAIFPSKLFGEKERYLFELSETGGSGRPPWDWTLDEKNGSLLGEKLFPDILGKEKNIKKALKTFTRTNVWSMIETEDEVQKAVRKLNDLTGQDTQGDRTEIIRFIADSAVYVVESRCGITDGRQDFSYICQCRDEEVLYRVGQMVSQLSGRLLLDISRSMKAVDIERRQYYDRNSVYGKGRHPLSGIGRRDEGDGGSGKAEPIRQDGGGEPAGQRRGTLRNAAGNGNAVPEAERSTGAGGEAVRRDGGRPRNDVDEAGKHRPIRHHEDDKPADPGRYGGRDGGSGRNHQPHKVIPEEPVKEEKQFKEELQTREKNFGKGTADVVPFSMREILPGNLSGDLQDQILLKMTDKEEKQEIFQFFTNNRNLDDRKEYLCEIYDGVEVRKESKEAFISFEGGRDGFYLFWAEQDVMYEAYWHWEAVCHKIESYIREAKYLTFESISEIALEEQDADIVEVPRDTVMTDGMDPVKEKILDIGEAFFAQKVSTDILKQMLCRIYTTNQKRDIKSTFLQHILTQCGEAQHYYTVFAGGEKYELQTSESGIRLAVFGSSEDNFPNIQFDWEEFGDLTAHLVEKERIVYSDDSDTITRQEKMYQMLPWFQNLYHEYIGILEKEELKVPDHDYHDAVRKEAAKVFAESSVAMIPYQALIYDFFQFPVSQEMKVHYSSVTGRNATRHLIGSHTILKT